MLEHLLLPGANSSKTHHTIFFLEGVKSFLLRTPDFARSKNFSTTITEFLVGTPKFELEGQL